MGQHHVVRLTGPDGTPRVDDTPHTVTINVDDNSDFLDVQKYPVISFRSTKVEADP